MAKNSIGKFATTIGGGMCRNKSLQFMRQPQTQSSRRLLRGGMLYVVVALLLAVVVGIAQANDNLRVAYHWKQVDFNYPDAAARANAISTGAFIPENVIPVGLEVYKTRLFLTLPRWKTGVPASLVYIDMADNSTLSPKLTPYPNWEAHNIANENEPAEIISPFRIRADRCGRLWVLDTGYVDILGDKRVVSPTRLLVYDLHNDAIQRRYEFPADQQKSDSFFANIAVEDADCEDTYAYAGDLGTPGLVVYSWKRQESWRVHHNYFHPDPLSGNYSITGIQFQWDDGLFGLALSKAQSDGFATLYFHPLSSTNEFAVSTRILRDKDVATNSSGDVYREFKVLGSRGPDGQSAASFLDQLTGVLFYSLPNLNAVACWRTNNKAYTIKSQGRIYMNMIEMQFPNDVKVDDQDRLWVLSDRLQQFIYGKLDANDVNFRILTAHVKDAIENTACDTKPKTLPDIITKLGDILRPQTTANPNANSAAAATTMIIGTATAWGALIAAANVIFFRRWLLKN